MPTVRASIADGRDGRADARPSCSWRAASTGSPPTTPSRRSRWAGRSRARSRCLGKAAVAEGLFEDALPVLQAALELDPAQPAVRTLLRGVEQHLAA